MHIFHTSENMAAYTAHAVERRAERQIKKAYIQLCLEHGVCSNEENDYTGMTLTKMPFLNKHHYHGLTVISVPNKQKPIVITAYWIAKTEHQLNICIQKFDSRVRIDKQCREGQGLQSRAKKSKKSGSKSTKPRNISVDIDPDQLDYAFEQHQWSDAHAKWSYF